MNNSFINILDIPEEILLNILNKLHNLDVLFTQSIDLTSILSNEKDNSKTNAIFNRFCSQILRRIHNNSFCLSSLRNHFHYSVV